MDEADVVEDVASEPAVVRVPVLVSLGITAADLTDRLGFSPDDAAAALAAADEDAILALAQVHEGSWIGMVLIDLASGDSIDDIVEQMELAAAKATADADADLLASLKRPGAQAEFAFIEGQDELRQVIEAGDFGAWRIFLHPEQRRYVAKSFSGPFRLSGGAGTGKTVVLVHRARHLARTDPSARIVLTTFTTNLAELLKESLVQLDPTVPLAKALGPAINAVFGLTRTELASRTSSGRWRAVLDSVTATLGPGLANEAFLAAEYETVVLPHQITVADDHLKVRRSLAAAFDGLPANSE